MSFLTLKIILWCKLISIFFKFAHLNLLEIMTSEIIKRGIVVGGFDMPTILPRAAIGDRLSLEFDGTSDWASRITVRMKDGQFAGHINLILADDIFALRRRISDMWGIARQVSSRRNPGWEFDAHLILLSI
jgi:hypothetical protein